MNVGEISTEQRNLMFFTSFKKNNEYGYQWDFERNDISGFTFSLKVVVVSIFILSKTSELVKKLNSKVQNAVPLRNPQMS